MAGVEGEKLKVTMIDEIELSEARAQREERKEGWELGRTQPSKGENETRRGQRGERRQRVALQIDFIG